MNTDRESVRCLSVRRPWANLIVAGYKLIENRTWTTGYRGRVVIHAGKTWDHAGAATAVDLGALGMDSLDHCAAGYLGSVRLDDVHAADDCCTGFGDPTPGVYHWVLSDPIALSAPLPGRGRLGLYSCDDADLVAAIARSVHPTPVVVQVNPIVARAAALGPIQKNTWKRRRDPDQLTLLEIPKRKGRK